MTQTNLESKTMETNQAMAEKGLAALRESNLRFVAVVVLDNGDLQLVTQEDSNRIEMVGLLEVGRDALRS